MTENIAVEKKDPPPSTTPWRTTKEAAAHLRLSPDTLARWRCEGKGPPWHRPVPGGNVAYHIDEIDAWMREGCVPCSESSS